MDLEGRVAIVTGAAGGTGRATAVRLGPEGAAVVVAGVDAPGGEATAAQIAGAGGEAVFVCADVRVAADVEDLVAQAAREDGGPQVLVNNAGGGSHVPPHFPDATPAQRGATLDLNLRGAMLATSTSSPRWRGPAVARS